MLRDMVPAQGGQVQGVSLKAENTLPECSRGAAEG